MLGCDKPKKEKVLTDFVEKYLSSIRYDILRIQAHSAILPKLNYKQLYSFFFPNIFKNVIFRAFGVHQVSIVSNEFR